MSEASPVILRMIRMVERLATIEVLKREAAKRDSHHAKPFILSIDKLVEKIREELPDEIRDVIGNTGIPEITSGKVKETP